MPMGTPSGRPGGGAGREVDNVDIRGMLSLLVDEDTIEVMTEAEAEAEEEEAAEVGGPMLVICGMFIENGKGLAKLLGMLENFDRGNVGRMLLAAAGGAAESWASDSRASLGNLSLSAALDCESWCGSFS